MSTQSRANYKVFMVGFESQQKNHQLIANGLLVRSESQAEIKIYLVKTQSQADILICAKNFPKSRWQPADSLKPKEIDG